MLNKRQFPIILSFILCTICLTTPLLVLAADDWWDTYDIADKLDLPDKKLDSTAIEIVRWVLSLTGLTAVIFILYGGFTWMTSAGNEEKVKKAKGIIKAAVIGLVIILLAWAITIYTVNVLTNATTTPLPPP